MAHPLDMACVIEVFLYQYVRDISSSCQNHITFRGFVSGKRPSIQYCTFINCGMSQKCKVHL